MGNSFNPADFNKEYENVCGKKLIRAIKANSPTQLEESYEMAKKELLPRSKGTAHDKEYENMIRKMTLYLTRGYDVGDGMLFKKTPLQIAEEHHSDLAITFINRTLAELKKNEIAAEMLEEQGLKVKANSVVGDIDKDRVHQAKERLKQFQKDYEQNKKK